MLATLALVLAAAAAEAAPALALQTGHTGIVNGLAFSGDGRLLASVDSDNALLVWDASLGAQLLRLPVYANGQGALAFQPRTGLLAVGERGAVQLWDLRRAEVVARVGGLKGVPRSLSFSGDGQLLAVGVIGGAVQVFEMAGRTQRALFEDHGFGRGLANSVALAADGKLLASAGRNQKGVLHALSPPDAGRALPAPQDEGAAVALSPDGKLVALAVLKEPAVRLFSTAGAPGEPLRTLAGHPEGGQTFGLVNGTEHLGFTPDGRALATAGSTAVRLWDVATGALRWEMTAVENGVHALAVDPTGRHVAVADRGYRLRLLDLATGKVARTFDPHAEAMVDLAFSRDSRTLLAQERGGAVQQWDLTRARLVRVHACGKPDAGPGSLALSPDGQRFACAGPYNLKVFSIAGGPGVAVKTKLDDGKLVGLAFSADGKRLWSAHEDGRLRAWDPARGTREEAVDPREGADGPVELRSLRAGPGGALVVATKEKLVEVRRPDGEKVLRTLPPGWDASFLPVSLDGRVAALSGLFPEPVSRTGLFDLATGAALATVEDPPSSFYKALSADGRLLATAGFKWFDDADRNAVANTDTSVRLWDAATGARLSTLTGAPSLSNALAISPDGRLLAAAGDDGVTTLFDLKALAHLASLAALDRAHGVIALPSGHYTASKAGLQGVAFRVGDRGYPFEQFDLAFNRPDLVLAALGGPPALVGAYRKAAEKRAKRMKLSGAPAGGALQLPEVRLAKAPPLATSERKLTLEVAGKATGADLDRLLVHVNGVPAFAAAGLPLAGKARRELKQTVELVLSAGLNRIEVSALDARGLESLRDAALVELKAPAARPALYLLAVGVSAYQRKEYELRYAAKDAQDLAAAFAAAPGRWAKLEVKTLLDAAATREGILAQRAFLERAGPDDVAVVFVAGHGLVDGSLDYFFATPDLDFEAPAARGLPFEQLEGLLDGLKARRRLLLVDTCQSGEVDKDEAVVAAAPAPGVVGRQVRGVRKVESLDALGLRDAQQLLGELFADLRRGTGAQVIASASGLEFALESEQWRNGTFTYALLEGLRGGAADANKDGAVTVSELRDYVVARVQALTQGQQTPTARRETVTADFEVGWR